MKIKRINKKEVIDEIAYKLPPQINWIPKDENWNYLYCPGDCEILIRNTKENRRFMMNFLRAMKKEEMLKRKGLESSIEKDKKKWFNKNIPLTA